MYVSGLLLKFWLLNDLKRWQFHGQVKCFNNGVCYLERKNNNVTSG